MSTSISSFFLAGVLSFPNSYRTIYSGLIHFVLISFIDPVPMFEAMDMVYFIAVFFRNFNTPSKTVISSPDFRSESCDEETHPVVW